MMEIKELCEVLNRHIPCIKPEDSETVLKLLKENIDDVQDRHVRWSEEILYDTDSNEEACLKLVVFSHVVTFIPTPDQDKDPGVTVIYKHESNHVYD